MTNIRDHGATGDGVTDDTGAILAAQAAAESDGEPLYFPAGDYLCSTTLTHWAIEGASSVRSILRYTGTGSAIAPPTPAVRTHRHRIAHLAVLTPPATDPGMDGISPPPGAVPTATVGIDWPHHSRGHVEDVLVAGFALGVKLSSPNVDGGCLYDTFINVVAGGCTTGFQISGRSTNEHKFIACRANGCGTGWHISDGNHNVLVGCAVESGGDGVVIDGTDTDRTQISHTRFENLSGVGLSVAETVRGTVALFNDMVGTGGGYDIGSTDTMLLRGDPGNATVQLSRSAPGASPLLVLADTETDEVSPTTVEVRAGRWSGYPLRVVRSSDGVELLRANGDGAVKVRKVTSLPSASRAGAGALLVYAPSGNGRLIMSTGSTWVYVDGGGTV